jgi:hypothetical protein
MRGLRYLVLGVAIATAFAAPVALAKKPAAPAAQSDRTKALLQFQRDLASVLALRNEAQPLLGAALLARPLVGLPDVLSYHNLLQRAAQSDDAGPAVTWAQLADCNAKASECPNTEALTKLQSQAPENAAVWLLKLGQDARDGKNDAVREDLGKAANAKLYDDYMGSSLQALANSVSQLPPPANTYDPLSGAGNAGIQVAIVYGLASAQPIPGFQAVAKVCDGAGDDQALRGDCLKLAKTLEWGSSALGRSLGLHLREVLSADDAQQADARHARTNLVWQIQQFAQLSVQAQGDKPTAQRLLSLARSGGTEMSVVLASLHAYGIPIEAPEGWEPAKAKA